MTKSLPSQEAHSPFFDLLADADEIQIRESTTESTGRVRSFVVHIKSANTKAAPSSSTSVPYNNAYNPAAIPPASSSPLPGTVVTDYDFARLLQSAELLLDSADYVLARNLFSYLLNENLRDARALRGLGICLHHLSDRVSARKCFKAWFELHQSEEALLWLGKSFAAEGDSASSLTALTQISPTQLPESDRFEYLKTLGSSHAKNGNTDQAENCFRSALDMQPQNDSIWVNLGSLELQKGSPSQADRSFRQALQIQPRNSKAYCGLGLVALASRNITLSCAYFHKALELDAENWLALEQWVNIFHASQDFKRLEGHLLRFLEIHPRNAEALALGADLYERMGKSFESERYIALALEVDPKNVRALLAKNRAENAA